MADLGEKLTDKRLEETEKKLRRLYTEAEKDLKAKVQEYTKDFLRIDKHKRELLAAGKITEEDYKRWQKGQVFIGNRWDAKVAQMARSLVNVEKTAVDIVQRGQMSCFADNTNYFEYRLDKDHDFSGNFGLYDTATVTRLVKEQPELLRRRFVDGVKCEAWNQKVIYNTITQGILQGESIPKIAQRMARDTASTDMKAMVRYARTAMTCAQNSGRLYAMRAGQKQGIYTRKMWIAVSDERTRDAHLELDGKVEELDKPFSNEIGLIMFPGDPEADDANVWNCRCALGYEYPEGQDTTSPTDDEDAEYGEWVEEHEEPAEKAIDRLAGIREIIDKHEGKWSTDELISLGAKVAEEVDEEIQIQRQQYAEIEKDIQSVKETMDKLQSKAGYAQSKEYIEAKEKLKALYTESKKLKDGMNALPVLEKIRECGGVTAENVSKYADFNQWKTNKKETQKIAIESMNHYPKAWLDKSAEYTTSLKPHWTTGRPRYSPFNGEIKLSQYKSDGIHELGHRFEYVLKQIMTAEKEFYERRTSNEKVEWLGHGFNKDEVTRRDHFINRYMGKDYEGNCYELVSMGFQYVFTDYESFSKGDEEMRNWILGILSGL